MKKNTVVPTETVEFNKVSRKKKNPKDISGIVKAVPKPKKPKRLKLGPKFGERAGITALLGTLGVLLYLQATDKEYVSGKVTRVLSEQVGSPFIYEMQNGDKSFYAQINRGKYDTDAELKILKDRIDVDDSLRIEITQYVRDLDTSKPTYAGFTHHFDVVHDK